MKKLLPALLALIAQAVKPAPAPEPSKPGDPIVPGPDLAALKAKLWAIAKGAVIAGLGAAVPYLGSAAFMGSLAALGPWGPIVGALASIAINAVHQVRKPAESKLGPAAYRLDKDGGFILPDDLAAHLAEFVWTKGTLSVPNQVSPFRFIPADVQAPKLEPEEKPIGRIVPPVGDTLESYEAWLESIRKPTA